MLALYDPTTSCVKCGYRSASVVFIAPVLKRACGRCGFGWSERPLDAMTPEEREQAERLTVRYQINHRD